MKPYDLSEYFKFLIDPNQSTTDDDDQNSNILFADRSKQYANALIYTLNNQKTETSTTVYEDFKKLASNQCVTKQLIDIYQAYFNFPTFPKLIPIYYPLLKFTLTQDIAIPLQATMEFLEKPNNLHAYAGQKFDQIVIGLNKKYSLGLPLSFYDWQLWSYSTEISPYSEDILEAIDRSSLIETQFDPLSGFLWILAMSPIPRTEGATISKFYIPKTIEGITDWQENLFDKEEVKAVKGKGSVSPASICRQQKDPCTLR